MSGHRLLASDPHEAMAVVAAWQGQGENGHTALSWLKAEGKRFASQSVEDGDSSFYASERINGLCDLVLEAWSLQVDEAYDRAFGSEVGS